MNICPKCKTELRDGALFCDMCGKALAPKTRKRRKRANGSGTIYKMAGNRSKPWGIKRDGVYMGAARTYAEAQKILERTTDQTITDRYNWTFQEVYEAWKPVHAREVKSMGNYTAAYKHCTDLHDRRFRELRKSDFQAVILAMEQRSLSKSTCEKVLQLFGQLGQWAVDECIVPQNHARGVTIVAEQKGKREAFSDLQLAALKKSTDPAAAIVLILVASGARPGELFTVPLVNCREDHFIGGSKTEAGMNRVIPIAPLGLAAYTALRRKAIEKRCRRLIDAYEGNRSVNNFNKRDFKPLMEQLGCPHFTTYNCRHTFVTLAIRAGVPQAKLRQIVGHMDDKTTDIYTHLQAADLVAAVQKIGAAPDGRADNLQVSEKVN